MKEETEQALNQNFFQEKTKFEIIEEKFKNTVFGLLNILLKFDDDDDFAGEVVGLINETCQYLYYPFYDPMLYLWKKEKLFTAISKTLSYFQTVVFFNNTQLYIVAFYAMVLLVIFVVIDMIYVAYALSSKNKASAVWPMRLLRSVVSFIVTVMFNPMVEFLLAILECSNRDENNNLLPYYQNYNVDDMHCWTNTHFIILVVLSISITLIFLIICTVVQLIFYETKTSEDCNGAKTNSFCDIVTLFVKLILILIYSFLVWKKSLHWIVVPATFLVSLIQYLVYKNERPFYEEKMNTAFLVHTGVVLWSTIVLFLVKILENSEYDGGIFVFIIGTPIVFFIIVTLKDNRFQLLLTNQNKFDRGELIFKQIRFFLELVDKKHKDRKSNILLKGYIYIHEEYCTLADCPLKKYLKEIEKTEKAPVPVNVNGTQTGYGMESANNVHTTGPVPTQVGTTLLNTQTSTSLGQAHSESDLYLFQYAMNMYQNGISKFPNCTSLRMNYAFFLMERMNNNKKSLVELKNCEKYDPTFEEQFIIYRFTQNAGADTGGGGDDDGDDDEGLDIVSNIAYKNYYNMFKECLTNITEIYTEFWTLLLNHSSKSDEDMTKMNEYGEKINKLIEEIKMNYDEMEKIKYNDAEVLTLYSDFFADILNDNTQAEYYKSRLIDIQGNSMLNDGDKREANELLGLPVSDEFQYIFLTAEGSSMGTIIKVSLGICSMFGYTSNDLVGKHIDFIMPDMYQELHKQVLINKLNKYKTQINQNYRNNIKGGNKPSYREIFVFGKNKLKHAVPMAMKVTLMCTQDQSELFFASRIFNDDLYNEINAKNPSPGVPSIINFNMKVCYVLVDLDFIVQFYTPNAINFLGFKSNTSGNIDITKSISELNNNEEKNETGKMTKSEIFTKKYLEPKVILWKSILNEDEEWGAHVESTADKLNMKGLMNYSRKIMLNMNNNLSKHSSSKDEKKPNQFMKLKRQRMKEDYFTLSVSEINIINQPVGYVFRFEVAEMGDDDLDGYDENRNFAPGGASNFNTNKATNVINPMYIPEINKKFDLDTKKLAFFSQKLDGNCNTNIKSSDVNPSSLIKDSKTVDKDDKDSNNNNDSGNSLNGDSNWHSKLREFATEKLNRFKAKVLAQKALEDEEEEEEDEEEEDESSYTSNENSSDNMSNSNIPDNKGDDNLISKNNEEENKNTPEEDKNNQEENTKINEEEKKEDKKEEDEKTENNNVSNEELNKTNTKKSNKSMKKSAKRMNSSGRRTFKSRKKILDKNAEENEQFLQKEGDNSKNEELTQLKRQNSRAYLYDYYHVKCLGEIKFSIYDFKKQKLIDVNNVRRESQVEYRKKEGAPELRFHPNAKKGRMMEKNYNENEEEEEAEKEDEDTIDPVLVKQIEYALRKEQYQPEITKIKWISRTSYVICLAIFIVFFILMMEDISQTKENFIIIHDIHQLISNVINGVYYIRELVLLNNDNYFKLIGDKKNIFGNITESLDELFQTSYTLQQNILTTSLKLTKSRKNLLLDGKTNVYLLEENSQIKSIEISVNSAITQIFTSLYQIKNSELKNIYSLNPNVFFYMRNCFDPIITSLKQNAMNFVNEYDQKIIMFKKRHLYIIIAITIVLIIFVLLIQLMYNKIMDRKSGYLEVFFEIDDNVCKKALDKCDSYSKVLHPLIGDEQESVDDDDENRNHRKKLSQKTNAGVYKKEKSRKKDNSKNLKFLFKISFIFCSFLAYFLATILFFERTMDTMENYSESFNITFYQSHMYLSFFDKLREYFYDKNSIIGDNNFEEEIDKLLKIIYQYQRDENSKFLVNQLPSSYKKIYKNLHKNSLCDYVGDLFKKNQNENSILNGYNCSTYTGNSSDYGIDVLISYYLEIIRNEKFDFDVIINNLNGLTYNNTLYTPELSKEYNESNTVLDDPNIKPPFSIFNNDIVTKLGVIRNYYIKPVYIFSLNEFYNSIKSFWDNGKSLYVALLVVLIVGFTLFFAFYWIPLIWNLDKDIYKTKNMLAIIPKDVLASLSNINNLLNIGTSLSNNLKAAASALKDEEKKVIN